VMDLHRPGGQGRHRRLMVGQHADVALGGPRRSDTPTTSASCFSVILASRRS
jgi:hypothetical protein